MGNLIINFYKKYDYVVNRLFSDDLFILHFIKDPQKQSFHQKAALEYLAKVPMVSKAIQLPSSGSNALYVINGQLIFGYQITTSQLGKSIDFKWEYVDKDGVVVNCYATHKHTKVAGGTQDNQFKDVINFFENSSKYSNHKNGSNFFYAICDGQYYQNPYGGFKSKIEYLNSTYKTNSSRIHATSINDLENHLKTI